MTDALVLDPKRTALVLIDLQRGIMGRQTAPHSASDVLSRSNQLAKKCREVGAPFKLIVKPGADHGWPGMEKDIAVLADWFDEHLRGLKPAAK